MLRPDQYSPPFFLIIFTLLILHIILKLSRLQVPFFCFKILVQKTITLNILYRWQRNLNKNLSEDHLDLDLPPPLGGPGLQEKKQKLGIVPS
jgi:hypothetical protein